MEEHNVVVARFISAARKGEDEVVKEYLTDKEFNITPHEVDATGETALHWASKTVVSTVELLLSLGAKVGVKDSNGETPLHKAAWRNQTETVEVLIQHGALIEETNKDGKKPFDLATDYNTRRALLPQEEGDEPDTEAREDEDSD